MSGVGPCPQCKQYSYVNNTYCTKCGYKAYEPANRLPIGEFITHRLDLIKCKLEILKLKADKYNWQCHIPDDIKQELEELLVTINRELRCEDEDEL